MLEIMNILPSILAAGDTAAEAASGISITLDSTAFGLLGGVIACGIIVMGAAKGIGGIAGKATEAIARQPEAGGRIFTTMIIAAALIEGVTLFALIICLMAVL